MGKRSDMPRSFEEMEQRYLLAIERIRKGSPLCPELAEKAKLGKLTLTVSTVALEAGNFVDEKWKGLSRTSIGYAGCRYSRVYLAIVNKGKSGQTAKGQTKLNEELRQQNSKLERRCRLLISEMGAMARRMEAKEKEVKDKLDEIMRKQARGDRHAETMPTVHIGENVSSFRRS